jgi:macrodomain Ter protein organizer (MatP/YcbG family)
MTKRRYIDVDDVAWERLKMFCRDIGIERGRVITAMVKMLTRLPPISTVESSLMAELRKIFTEDESIPR